MRIAVASEKEAVAEHFGRCETFMVFDTENEQIVKTEAVPNPGHRPGFLPRFLHDLGVQTIISGGMGGSAVELFNGIFEVIVGLRKGRTSGPGLPAGNLKTTGSVSMNMFH